MKGPSPKRRHNFLHCAGPWPQSIKRCLIVDSTIQGERADPQALQLPKPLQQALQLPKPLQQALQPSQKINPYQKYTRKLVHLVKDDDEPGPSREQEEPEPEVITRSLSLSELRDMQKDFSHLPGEHIITWLLRCWDNGASSLELEGREAKQLGSLSREGGIDKAIGKKALALSLWR
ncbi:hypothetical protein GRJ2_003136000 [Grus japonensis]|uniref:Uncharacterized protein n=1 Tax=Grus japonensis TaxID=30415 RepID=A0ABC9YAK8_GRUJA